PRLFFSRRPQGVPPTFPTLSVTWTTHNTIHSPQALVPGEAECGSRLNPQTSRELQVRAFAEMNMGIVVPTGHPLASRSAVRFSQCLDYPFILPSAPLMISEPVEALVNISGNEVKEVAVSNNITSIRPLIKEQMGIGILCRRDIPAE
ncbi:LysR family transcriptional regulator substrate-binding protein, partial [Staphylococcus aureus]|nr:LysR family transcriptional regulator substrate-binding protein [Staphylococcus aureus]